MDFSLADINWLAVVVAALVYFFMGSIWYSPVLFASAWMKEIGKTKEDLNPNPFLFFFAFLFTLVASFAVAAVFGIAGLHTFIAGLVAGLMIGVAIAASMALNFMYEGKSPKLYLITIGYHAVSFPLMGIILALWK